MKSVGGLFSGLAARLAKHVRAAAASRWVSPVARAAVAALGLVVLAAIGRSALAGGATQAQDQAHDAEPTDPSAHAPASPAETLAAPVVALATSSGPIAAASALPLEGTTLDAGDAPPRSRATPDDPVFLNQASLADLRRLPGVGAKRAQAILALRERLHGFSQLEDLLKVKGVGRKSLKKLRPLVRLDLLASPPDAGATPPPP